MMVRTWASKSARQSLDALGFALACFEETADIRPTIGLPDFFFIVIRASWRLV
jgi:hypothetical protein